AQQAALERRSRNFLRALVGVFAVAAIVAVILTIFAFNQQGIAQDNAATAVAEADARATQQLIAESEAMQRATQQAIAENEAIARGEAEQEALDERDRAVEAEFEARKQAAIGLAGQAMNELNGRRSERAVPLALEALEDYPYTWQAQRALGISVLNHKLEKELEHEAILFMSDLSDDGERLLTSSMDGSVRIWDIEQGTVLAETSGLLDFIASWSPDESHILIIADDNANTYWIQILDGFSGEIIHSNEVDSECLRGFVYHPWSPDGEKFITAHTDGSARIWDSKTAEEIIRLTGHEGNVIAEWSPTGEYILTNGIEDGKITMWNASNGEQIYSLPAPTGGSSFRGWSPSGDRFVVRDFEKAHIYQSDSGEELITLDIPGTTVNFAGFSPDGTQLITSGFEDGIARLWDLDSQRELGYITGLTQAEIISWSPSGKFAAIGAADGLIRIWDTADISVREELFFPHDVEDIHWSLDERRIIVSGSFRNVQIFNLNQSMLDLPQISSGVIITHWSPDGDQIGFATFDSMVRIFDINTMNEVFSFDSGDEYAGFAWTPSGEHIITYNSIGPIRLWDAETGEQLAESAKNEDIFNASFSPDGKKFIGTSWLEEGRVGIWNANTLEEINSFFLDKSMSSDASWSPDGKFIATTSMYGEASIRDAETAEVIIQLLPEDYSEQVEGIVWTKDGSQVILFTLNKGYRFNASTGETLMQYFGHTSAVYSIQLSPDEKLMYTASGDGTVRVFDLETGAELLVYEIGGWTNADLSPDNTQLLISNTDGEAFVYPVWETVDDLIAYAKDCCLVYELTPEEREQFGLPPNE
ncbi:MAG: WD40 repeat domain-containing protein, partial [Anaerolineales bacterium]